MHTGNGEILSPAVKGRNAVILPRYQPPAPPRQAAGRGCATRSASGLSGLSCRRSCRIRRSASRQRQVARH